MTRTLLTTLGLTAALALTLTPATVAAHASTRIDQATKMSDKTLQDRIEYRLESNDLLDKYDIHVKVDGGMAWLSGDVRTEAQKTEAGKLAKIDGISTVANDIKINPDADKTVAERTKKGFNKAGAEITDAWIITKIHWFFMGEDLLKDSEINVDVDKRVVTLKGTVKSAAGRARAMRLAQRTDGVTRVVDLLTIK